MSVFEQVAEMEHMPACESHQRLLLSFREWLMTANAMAWSDWFLSAHGFYVVIGLVVIIHGGRWYIDGSHVNVVFSFNHNVEFDTLSLPRAESILCSSHFTTEYTGDARADAVLDFVFFNHATQAVSEALDFQTFGNAANKGDRVDCSSDLLQKAADEARLVH